jgi:hypothetical protein
VPYIKVEDKKRFNKMFQELLEEAPKTAGELNYILTNICLVYLEDMGVKYQTYNDIIGVLECCKQELYRRKIAEYENKKRDENGEVY